MKKNMGAVDRVIRIVLAALFAVLYFTSTVAGTPGLVLLVEDNSYNQTLARIILQHAGFSVNIAENGAQALEMLPQNQYQLVLMDVHMPVMDGHQAAQQLRRDGFSLPLVALFLHLDTVMLSS